MTSIYALIDPRDNCVFYVGQTTTPPARLKQHLYDGRRGASGAKSKRISDILDAGLLPELKILQEHEGDPGDSEGEWQRKLLPQSSITGYARAGRKVIAGTARDTPIQVRFSPAERATLRARCDARGVTVSDALRDLARGAGLLD